MIDSFAVSRVAIRQALGDLRNEGLILKVAGKDSFVAKPKAFQNLSRLQGFGEAMRPFRRCWRHARSPPMPLWRSDCG